MVFMIWPAAVSRFQAERTISPTDAREKHLERSFESMWPSERRDDREMRKVRRVKR
jgi:hypothetical protein